MICSALSRLPSKGGFLHLLQVKEDLTAGMCAALPASEAGGRWLCLLLYTGAPVQLEGLWFAVNFHPHESITTKTQKRSC